MSTCFVDPADRLAPLDALPWLVPPGSVPEALFHHDRPIVAGSIRLGLRAAFVAAIAALGGASWHLAVDADAHGRQLIQQTSILPEHTPAAPVATPRGLSADLTTRFGSDPAGAKVPAASGHSLIPGENRPDQKFRSAPVQPVRGAPVNVRTPPPAPLTAPSSAAGQLFASAPAEGFAPPPPPTADSPASAATLGEFESTMDECSDAIRELIRLGGRQRHGRRASAEEQFRYRLVQQNADAAKTYRSYLSTLARSARGTKTETSARQSLDKARQTLAYLDTMLADSKAALR